MKRKREKYQIPYRVNLIFLVVFVLFSVLILRLGLIQIVYGENYSRKVEKAQNAPADKPQIAVAVAVPSAFQPNIPNTITKELARSALDTYFDLKKKGEQGACW